MKNRLEKIRDFDCVIGRAALVFLAIAWFLAGCSGNAAEKHAPEGKGGKAAMPVTVADVVQKDVPVTLQAVGQVEANATVTVKAQVEGELIAVHLREGQCVHAGDPLFNIDPRPFEAQLKQVQGNLAKDKALLENARIVRQRAASVVGQGYISKERYDQALADEAAFEATVQSDNAVVEKARIQLAYCAIGAPISGCAGEVFVDKGNVVKANDADHPLVVIRQIDPILAAFSVPERYLPEVKKYSAGGKLTVLAALAGHEGNPAEGQLIFVDNSVNASTGTILLKASFANGDQRLWPGQFVNVTLRLATQGQAVVVPAQALQSGQNGQYVFTLKSDQTVELRNVRVARTVEDLAVIAEGLEAGERVVTDGQLRLFPGAPVRIVPGVPARQEAQRP